VDSASGIFETLPLKDIHTSKRKLRSEESPLDELVFSIERVGLLEPIVVRTMEKGFEVVAGNRRLEACRRLGVRRVLCQIVELDDKEAFEVSLIENVLRETLNPIDEAKAFKQYVDDYGYGGVSELARKIGKSQEYVSRRLQLLALPKEVIEEVMRRHITPSAAQELISLGDAEALKVMELMNENHLSVREVRNAARRRRQRRQQDDPPMASDLDIRYPDPSGIRLQRIDRLVGKAVASLKMDIYRLGEVADEAEDDEWVVRETLSQCRVLLNDQVDNLLRFKKKTHALELLNSALG